MDPWSVEKNQVHRSHFAERLAIVYSVIVIDVDRETTYVSSEQPISNFVATDENDTR